MAETHSPHDLQKFLDYTFEYPEILDEALTRRAYLNDQQKKEAVDMSPLATLGDAVLNVVVIDHFFQKDVRTKGNLTDSKIRHVKRERTRAFAELHNLQKFVQWGKGEGQDGIWTKGDKALDTVTEALIGAVYLDAQKRGCNGMTIVKEMLERLDFFESIK